MRRELRKTFTFFQEVIKDAFRMKVSVSRCFRAGKGGQGKTRLLIVTLDTPGVKQEILGMAPQLRGSDKWGNIYITPDLTPAEREAARKLREELTVRRAAGETNLVIRKGRIVTASSSNRPGVDSTARRAASHHAPAGATTEMNTSDASAVVTQTQTGPQETSSLVPTTITREQRQESQA